MTTLADKLWDQGIRLNSYANGNYKVRCPRCSATRKNKGDPCLSVTLNDDGAVWKCWNDCGFVGGVSDREERGEVIKFKSKEPPKIPVIGPLSSEAAEFFKARNLFKEVLSLAGVGSTTHFIPAKQTVASCIAFPYRDVGGKIVNVKFRTLDKEFAQIKNGKKLLFGWDRVDVADPQIAICEGEIDALSLTQAGISNAVSVPDGASDRKWDFLDDADLAVFTRVVIAGDADEKGKTLALELARRFGFERCWIVTWPEGCKDANDVLVKYGEEMLRACVDQSRPFPISGIHMIREYEKEIWSLYDNGHMRGVSVGWRVMDEYMTVRAGELSVVTGQPGAGKSEFVDAILVNLCLSQNWKFGVCSFENPPEEHFSKYAEKYIGMPFAEGPTRRMDRTEVQRAIQWADEKFFLIRTDDEAPTMNWILEKARILVLRHGIRGLVIDPYNEIEHQRGAMSETEYVSDMLNKVKRFARNHQVHVWFVAHPAKPTRNRDGQLPEPSLYDISGSANWANKADVGIVVVRDYESGSRKTTVKIKKVRFKAVGKPGEVEFEYDRVTGRYREILPPYPSRGYDPGDS